MSKQYGVESYYRYLQGDDKGLEELVVEYGDALVRFAYCIVRETSVAEDAVEDFAPKDERAESVRFDEYYL